MLDIARRAYSETISDVMQIIDQLSEKYEVSEKVVVQSPPPFLDPHTQGPACYSQMDLQPGYSKQRGFYLTTHTKQPKASIPPVFQQVVK